MAASDSVVRVVRAETRTTHYSEGQAPGKVVETQIFDHSVLGPVVCRVRATDGRTTRTVELSQEALEKLGFSLSFYRSKGVHKFQLENTNE